MIIGAEVGMLVMGLIALVSGWFPVAKNRAVRGVPARFLGLIAILQMPVAIATVFAVFFIAPMLGTPIPKEMAQPIGTLIDILSIVGFVSLTTVLGYRWSDPERLAAAQNPDADEVDFILVDEPSRGWSIEGSEKESLEDSARASGMARASLMLGVFSLLTSLLGSIPAFILGGIALSRISRSGRTQGKGIAVAGIVLGVIGTFTGFIALALLVPLLKKAGDPGPVAVTPPINATPPRNIAPPRKNITPPQPVVAATPAPSGTPKPTTVAENDTAPAPKKRTSSRSSSKTKGGFNRPDGPGPSGGIDSKPVATGTSIASRPKTISDLKVTELKVEAASVPRCLVWGDGGEVVFVLEKDGTLRRIAVDGFVEELKWEIGQKCSWLSVSSEGLVLTVDGLQEVWSLDPKTFAIKTRTATASVTRAGSAPATSYAFATSDKDDGNLAIIDLKAGRVVREYTSRSFPEQNVGFGKLVVSPDGKSVFAEGMERLMLFEFEGEELSFSAQSDRIAQNGRAIEISDDGTYVALPSGGGNYGKPAYTTFVYRTSDLSKPEIKISAGAYPQALGFDLKAGFIYAQNFQEYLILFQPSGIKSKAYNKLSTNRQDHNSPRQFLVHPDGGKLFVLSDTSLLFVELSAKAKPAKPAAP